MTIATSGFLGHCFVTADSDSKRWGSQDSPQVWREICMPRVLLMFLDRREWIIHRLVTRATEPSCDVDGPNCFFGGLAVDLAAGDCYVAPTGCRCVVKIAPDGVIETVMKSEHQGSPTGVAVHNGEIYAWSTRIRMDRELGLLPRVRKTRSRWKDRHGWPRITAEQQRAQPGFKRD
jgi:hypothetical protein